MYEYIKNSLSYDPNTKIQCPCGGSYTKANKNRHIKTKKCIEYHNNLKTNNNNDNNNIDKMEQYKNNIMDMLKNCNDDQKIELYNFMRGIIPESEPVAEPAEKEKNKIEKLRGDLMEKYNKDLMVNMCNPDMDDDVCTEQDNLEVEVANYLDTIYDKDESNNIYENFRTVAEYNYRPRQTEIDREFDIDEFNTKTERLKDVRKELIDKNIIDVEKQYQYFIKLKIEQW